MTTPECAPDISDHVVLGIHCVPPMTPAEAVVVLVLIGLTAVIMLDLLFGFFKAK